MNIFDIFKKFNTQQKCYDHLVEKRWKNKIVCPYCGCEKCGIHNEKTKKRFICHQCNKSFSPTVGTIFHNSHIELNKWFIVISMMLNAKKGISSCQIARDLKMRQGTVWSMMKRIRKAMEESDKNKDLFNSITEIDEMYIGGKANNKHMSKRIELKGKHTQTPIIGLLDRNNKQVIVKSVNNVNQKEVLPIIYNNVKENSLIITDESNLYKTGIGNSYCHRTVNHSANEYSKKMSFKDKIVNITTNSIEGFWSSIRRGIIGQFHHISKNYLQFYINEFTYRYNNKNNKNVFEDLISNCVNIRTN